MHGREYQDAHAPGSARPGRAATPAPKAEHGPGATPAQRDLLRLLQRRFGNRFVQRALAGRTGGQAEVDPEVERSIHQARGAGQTLQGGVRAEMESDFGTALGGVRVHTGRKADELSEALGARAFTTGQDIFFRQGAFDPASPGGRRLLAHELTHVMQQATAQPQARLVVGEPDDDHEREAEHVATAVVRQPAPDADEDDMEQD
jgi:hypothetical protein